MKFFVKRSAMKRLKKEIAIALEVMDCSEQAAREWIYDAWAQYSDEVGMAARFPVCGPIGPQGPQGLAGVCECRSRVDYLERAVKILQEDMRECQ